MTEQEKVIKELGEVSAYFRSSVDAMIGGTLACDAFVRYADAAEKAIVLLKAQEPRVMTWEEAQANVQNGPFAIFEVRNSRGSKLDFGVLAGNYYEMSNGSVLTVADFWTLKDNYGKRFRLWASRPTEAEREATPWN